MPDLAFDRVVVGGGIVGLAVARELLIRRPGLRLSLLEKERGLALHQTGHNSGVIHSGVYYRPGSLKARLCLEGRERLIRFCQERGVAYRLTGKLIVATEENELSRLMDIYERGMANGVGGLCLIESDRIGEHEPHARGLRALRVPGAGVVNYSEMAAALAAEIREAGGEILLGRRLHRILTNGGEVVLETREGSVGARSAVVCAGLQSDRLAAGAGEGVPVRIVPFRGDYYFLREEAQHLIKGLIYPVPDPRFPFLGVHFMRRLDGRALAGPNAVLALAREGYGRFRFRAEDGWSTFSWPGFWRLARNHWRTGAVELWRDFVKPAYLRRLQRFVPELRLSDLLPGPCGIRAQAVARDGALVDDFLFRRDGAVTHVLNAPSPAATSSLAIAREIVDRLET